MPVLSLSLLLACTLPAQPPHANGQASASHTGKGAAPAPFSGTWILDRQRTHLQRESLPQGESRAVIEYDGKTWHYVHTHLEAADVLPDSWQIRLVVGSAKFQAEPGEGMLFRSRIERVGNTLVMHENGSDPNFDQGSGAASPFFQSRNSPVCGVLAVP